MKQKISLYFVSIILTIILSSSSLNAAVTFPKKKGMVLPTSQVINGVGTLVLQKSNEKNSAASQLILKKSNNITIIVDTYEGFEPFELAKLDFDNDGITEIVATLRYADSDSVIPYVYTIKEGLEKIFPKDGRETDLITCKEVFLTSRNSLPVLCLKYLVSYHDYAPPELYKLEMYSFNNGELQLCSVGYNEGTHFNLLMKYLHKGKTMEAANLYHEALASSTGDMSQKAFCEALFCNAEALKYSGKYAEAINLFEKIVLEYTDSNFTEIAQKELEFLVANSKDKNNSTLLEQFFKIQFEMQNDQNDLALTHLDELINKNPNCNFMDVLLFTKAELLVSENRVEEAFAVFTDIKVKFPKSGLIEYVDEMLENLDSKPEDIEGL